MRAILVGCGIWLAATILCNATTRVAVMDFEDQTGMRADVRLGGAIAPGALAAKGIPLLAKQLVDNDALDVIDRRDFLNQIDKLRPKDMGEKTPARPSFLHAAQALRADVVLRGSLLSFSTGKKTIDQGGYKTEVATPSLRVTLEALDVVDGKIIAMAEGSASTQVRQTAATSTDLSEDDVIVLLEKAIAAAVPNLQQALAAREQRLAERPKVKLSIKTEADPALLEIDGILVGSTPVEGLALYQGDHVITVGKPGYQDVTKRILFEKDTEITVPMIRTQLTADEMKDVLEKMRMSVVVGEPALIIHTVDDR